MGIIIERWRKVVAINKRYDKLNVRSFVLDKVRIRCDLVMGKDFRLEFINYLFNKCTS